MKKFLPAFLVFLGAICSAGAEIQPWTFLSITPSQVVGLEKYNNLFMISTLNGVWYSLDNGIYWYVRTPNPGTGTGIGDVHFKGKTIVASAYKSSFSYTLDQWMPIPTLNPSPYSNYLTNIKVTGNKVYASGGTNFFMRSDDGEKYSRFNIIGGSGKTQDIEDFDSVMVATMGDNFIYRSTDRGASWNKLGDTIPGQKMRLYRYFHKLFLSLSPTGVFESLDSGATWKRNPYFDDERILSSEFTDDLIYFAGSHKGIHISADSGYNWMPWNKGLYNTNTNFVRQIGDLLYCGLTMTNVHGVTDLYFYSTPVNFTNPLDIRIESVEKTRICQGDTMSIFFKVLSADRDSSDIITLALSDSAGSFFAPIHIDSLVNSGSLRFTFSATRDYTPSENYKLLVKSYSPHRKPQTDPDTINIAILANPKATMADLPTICNYDERILLTEGQPAGGYYKGRGVEDSVYFNPRNVTPGEHWITYYTVNPEGCGDSVSKLIKVFYAPSKPRISVSGDSLISNTEHGNQWYRNGVELEGETARIINTKNVEGWYTVRVFDTQCKSLMSDSVFVKDKSLAEGNFDLKVSPNPASNTARVYFDERNETTVKISVANSLGAEVMSLNVPAENGRQGVELNFDTLPSGVYLVKLMAGTQSQTLKLVVAR